MLSVSKQSMFFPALYDATILYNYWLWWGRHMIRLMTKPTKWLCVQRRLRSACTSAQFDQSSPCVLWVAKDPAFLHVDSEGWSDWADAQPDLSLRWAHGHGNFVGLSWGGSFGFMFSEASRRPKSPSITSRYWCRLWNQFSAYISGLSSGHNFRYPSFVNIKDIKWHRGLTSYHFVTLGI